MKGLQQIEFYRWQRYLLKIDFYFKLTFYCLVQRLVTNNIMYKNNKVHLYIAENSEKSDEIPLTSSDEGQYTTGGPRYLDHIIHITTSLYVFLATLEELLDKQMLHFKSNSTCTIIISAATSSVG